MRSQRSSAASLILPAEKKIKAAGFTLIEVLIVIAIIGIVVGMATVAVSSIVGRRDLDTFVNTIEQALISAGQFAILQQEEIGVFVHQHYLSFYRYNPNNATWYKINDEAIFKEQTVPSGIKMELWNEQQEVGLPADTVLIHDPQIIFTNGGELTPFSLRFIQKNGAGYQIQGKYSGELSRIRI